MLFMFLDTLQVKGGTQLLCHFALVQEQRKITSQLSFRPSPSAYDMGENWTQVLDLSIFNVINNFSPDRSLSKGHGY